MTGTVRACTVTSQLPQILCKRNILLQNDLDWYILLDVMILPAFKRNPVPFEDIYVSARERKTGEILLKARLISRAKRARRRMLNADVKCGC